MKYYIITPDDTEFVCLATSPEQALFIYWRHCLLRNRYHLPPFRLSYRVHEGQHDQAVEVSSFYAALIAIPTYGDIVFHHLIESVDSESLIRFFDRIERYTKRPIKQI